MKNEELIEETMHQRGLDTIMTIAQVAIDMYHSLEQPPKMISTKRAYALYGECRMSYWKRVLNLDTFSTKKGYVRYNQNQLDSLMRAEKSIIQQ